MEEKNSPTEQDMQRPLSAAAEQYFLYIYFYVVRIGKFRLQHNGDPVWYVVKNAANVVC